MAEAGIVRSCPLCDHSRTEVRHHRDRDINVVTCHNCGKYLVTQEAEALLMSPAVKERRFLLSALTRPASDRKAPLELLSHNIPELLALSRPPATPLEVLNSLLIWIHDSTITLTGYVAVWPRDYPLFCLRNREEFNDFLGMLRDLGYITYRTQLDTSHLRLTLKGWERILTLRATGRAATQAFVAMSYAGELASAWVDGFVPGLRDAGWTPVRVDALEHNDKIDDRIVAEIKRSGLVIADFTGHRAGVYFEAGLAMGLGLPVVWTVRDSDVSGAHFDTRQYNYIAWSDPNDLRVRLSNRVLATIGTPNTMASN